MTEQYTYKEAIVDFAAVEQHCGDGDPTAVIAFAEIVNRLLEGLSPSDFAEQPQIMKFVFTGLYRLRDWVFHNYLPSSMSDQPIFVHSGDFYSDMRFRLNRCNSGCGFCPDNIIPQALWEYYHNEFLPVVNRIRASGDAKTDLSFLWKEEAKRAILPRFEAVRFNRDNDQKILAVQLKEDHFSLPNGYFLGIKTKKDYVELKKIVLDRNHFKCIPFSLVCSEIFGVELQHELFPPIELPAQVGLHYFRLILEESISLWGHIKQEKAIAITCDELIMSDCQISLCFTI